MKFKDYFLGRKLELVSALPPSVVQGRIHQAAGSEFNPFSFGVVGRSRFRRFRLRFRSSLMDYNAKPMLVGRLMENANGTRILASFGATFWMKAFFVYWYVFLLIFSIVAIASGPFIGANGEEVYFPYLMLPLFVVAPIAMHVLFNRGGERELTELLAFLEKAADARLETSK